MYFTSPQKAGEGEAESEESENEEKLLDDLNELKKKIKKRNHLLSAGSNFNIVHSPASRNSPFCAEVGSALSLPSASRGNSAQEVKKGGYTAALLQTPSRHGNDPASARSPLIDSELLTLQRILTPRQCSARPAPMTATEMERAGTAGTTSSQFISYNRAAVLSTEEATEGGRDASLPGGSMEMKRRYETFMEEVNMVSGEI